MVSNGLIKKILASYPLAIDGRHGPAHWARVYENGLRLAEITGAKIEVVAIFAVMHDCRRTTESKNYHHGQNAADFAFTLRGSELQLGPDDFRLLYTACAGHAEGGTEGDITVQTCWDADRLDLARAGITPDPKKMCTAAARDADLIEWASQRALADYRPAILDEWLTASSG